jgi:hypothetical protein
MKNAVFWDVTPCWSCKNGRFGGTYRLHHQDGKHRGAMNVTNMLATEARCEQILCELVPTRPTRSNVPEDGILHSHPP